MHNTGNRVLVVLASIVALAIIFDLFRRGGVDASKLKMSRS